MTGSPLNPMRVALLAANPPQANPYIALLGDALAAAGVQAQIYTNPGARGLPVGLRADLLHLHWLELWGRPPYLSLSELARLGTAGRWLRRALIAPLNNSALFAWRRRRFLVHFFDALSAHKALGGRLVYTVHNLTQHEGEAGQVEAQALRRLLALADAVHVHDQSAAAGLAASLTALPRLAVIPHGNYVGAYPNQVGRQEARRRLLAPPDSFVYLFLGLIRPYKGLEELLAAFRRLQAPQALLLIAGQSRPPDYAARLAGAVVADPRVRWRPRFVPDAEVQFWLNAADVVVLPYRRVTTSGAALLALSFGRPVIAPALGAFDELLGHDDSLGLLYDPGRPDGLLEALRQAQAVDWRSRSPAILAWVRRFDWPAIGQQFADLYEELLQGRH